MKKFILMAILAVTTLTVVAAEQKRYELDVKDFNSLKVVHSINVDYICNPDSAGMAVFTASSDRASTLMFSNNSGSLSIQLAVEDRQLSEIPSVTVYSSTLEKIENDGDSTVRVLSVAPNVKFQGKVIGNGRLSIRDIRSSEVKLTLATGNGVIVANGTVSNLKINFSGTGTIQADSLQSEEVNIRAGGTGAIGCYATSKLNVYGAGSTKIYYKGSPEIKNRSIGIKTQPIAGEK